MSDTNMILLDKRNPNSAFKYDLGSGKVVEEWVKFHLLILER